jgi:hypothetical protein
MPFLHLPTNPHLMILGTRIFWRATMRHRELVHHENKKIARFPLKAPQF